MILRPLKLTLDYEKFKIQISMRVSFIFSKDTEETRSIYVWSDNEKIMWRNDTDNIIKELFKFSLDNYKKEEQIMTGGRNFVFESVELIDHECHKVSLKRGGSHIKSFEWLKNKGATKNPKIKKDDKFFQYSLTLALNYNETQKKELEKILKK